MQEGNSKGITIDGVPLESYLEKEEQEQVSKDVREIIKASKRNRGCIYFNPRKGHKNEERGHGPVTQISNIEIHEKNLDSYIKQAMKTDDIRGAIVGVLLGTNRKISAFDIKQIINRVISSDPVKSAQIRVHLGYIMKSELGRTIIREYTEGRSRGAKYHMNDNARTHHSFESAIKAAYHIVEKRTRRVKPKQHPDPDAVSPGEDRGEPTIDFILTDKNKLPVLEVCGRIDVHFHFHIS